MSGWITGDWIIRAVHFPSADNALDELVGFLSRHPDARVDRVPRAVDTDSR